MRSVEQQRPLVRLVEKVSVGGGTYSQCLRRQLSKLTIYSVCGLKVLFLPLPYRRQEIGVPAVVERLIVNKAQDCACNS